MKQKQLALLVKKIQFIKWDKISCWKSSCRVRNVRYELTAYHFLMAITPHVYSIYLQRTITGLPYIMLPASYHCSSIFRMINEASAITVTASALNTVNKRVTSTVAMNTERLWLACRCFLGVVWAERWDVGDIFCCNACSRNERCDIYL